MSKKLIYVTIIIGLACICFGTCIMWNQADLMEARNFITAREMVESGNYLIPTMNGALRFEKPPLPTWCVAMMINITNSYAEWILRIPVAMVSVIFVATAYIFVTHFTDNDIAGFLSSCVLMTTLMLTKTGIEANWDMFPYAFAFMGITAMCVGLSSRRSRYFILSGLLYAASLMSKGPVAIYGLVLPFVIAYFICYGRKTLRGNYINLFLMLVVTVLFTGIWPAMAISRHKDTFIAIMQKEKDTWSNRHVHGFFYYMDYFIYFGAWTFAAVGAILFPWSLRRTRHRTFSVFLYIWNILVIILLSIIKMKKKRYGLPIYMVSGLSIGMIFQYLLDVGMSSFRKSDKFLMYIQFAIILVASIIIPMSMGYGMYAHKLSYWYLIAAIICMIPIYIGFVLVSTSQHYHLFGFVIFASCLLFVSGNFFGNALISSMTRTKYDSIEPGIQHLSNVKSADSNIAYDRQIPIYSDDYEIEDVWNIGDKIVTLIPEMDVSSLPDIIYYYGKDLNTRISNAYAIEEHKNYINHKDEKVTLYKLYKKDSNIEETNTGENNIGENL